MSEKVVKICILKLGCIGSAPLLEYVLDERADRTDIEVRVISVGAKMTETHAQELAERALKEECDLYIIPSPNASLPGPVKVREILREKGKSIIVVSDAPARRITKELDEKGIGYIIVLADSMIGARRGFLDPTEMVIFNADVIKVLASTGVIRLFQVELDKVINALKRGEKPSLPRIVVDKEVATMYAEFKNPYAKAKAMAAYEIAIKVADLTVEGCFKIKERERYLPILTAAHEIMRYASILVDEAREIEKYGDTLVRTPHASDGALLFKEKLMEEAHPR
ncbi:MAG: F420-dependent methylenetetrahydromethanopterin dehydrogenase [Candidatus Methanomethylicia archaeon]|nr:F420-dependent methylenetetrahydromethanopterin dehydrogenase [Candidatus Methanomethylicia archaeon]MCX8168906.1 F420-dependent methylenetetrahydromethanopterin dehydrogenase [Candidatus Methanomethylicia archaeon]MDW7988638.1 F420-dependent methylenetetrahydromethanopterin dehydrogenase [Nitrososphaerota archaeon]